MKRFRYTSLLLLATVAATTQISFAQESEPAPPQEIKSFDTKAIDKTADPCTDFYQYSCGNWNNNNPIPADQVRWGRSFSLLRERNRYLLWKELDAAAKNPQSPLQKQYGDFYAACMNTDLIEKKGIAPLKPAFATIAELKDAKQFAALLSKLENNGVSTGFFNFGIGIDDKDSSKQIAEIFQGGISMPDRDYYLADQHKAIREKYIEHLKKMFILAGDKSEEATKEADAVMAIETAMAKSFLSRTELRDPNNRYHIYAVSELKKTMPNFDWDVYFKSVGIGHFDTLNVATPGYFKALNELVESQPISSWKSYLRWHALHAQAVNLPKAFFDENFAFFGKTLQGQKESEARWKQCSSMTDRSLGEAVGQDWVKHNFPPAAKDSMDKLVAALDKSLADDIRTLPWMSEETRKAAEAKLTEYRNKIGYPENWRDYSSIKVNREDAIGNAQRVAVYDRNYEFNKLGKPVDEKEWGMTPPTVNAYYNPQFNDINFPAGILQPPFFDFKIDPAVNFGGIGVVIGHEMTHGFDDQGSQYDGKGNRREWQTKEDRKAFVARTDCEVEEYNSFEVAPEHDGQPHAMLNGKLTLGENTADNGGIRIAYMALLDTLAAEGKSIDDKIDGYTAAQRYFISFAQVWCQNSTEQSARQLVLIDPHSPGKWRVNGTVQNFEEFGKAFGCKKGTPMYPEHSCRVW